MKSRTKSTIVLTVLAAFLMPAARAATPFKWPTAESDHQKVQDNSTQPSPMTPASNTTTQPVVASPPADQPPQPVDKATHIEAIKHYNRGVELHQSGFYNQAIEEYTAAVTADPSLEQAFSNLGAIYTAQKSYNKALDSFNKALLLKPDRPATLNGLATVLYARGKVQEAIDTWKKCLQIDPRFASAYYNIGFALEGLKKPYDAVGQYVRAISVNPKMPDPYFRIGAIYFKEKHLPQAQIMLNKAIQLTPDADFSKEARKELQSINSQFSAEGDSGEQVNVPLSGASGSTTAPASSSTDTKATVTEETKSHIRGLFAHKQKKDADIPTAASATTRQDLKEKGADQ